MHISHAKEECPPPRSPSPGSLGLTHIKADFLLDDDDDNSQSLLEPGLTQKTYVVEGCLLDRTPSHSLAKVPLSPPPPRPLPWPRHPILGLAFFADILLMGTLKKKSFSFLALSFFLSLFISSFIYLFFIYYVFFIYFYLFDFI
jgi:hypothetical protein